MGETLSNSSERGVVSVADSSTEILAPRVSRDFARLTNNSDTRVWLAYGQDAVIGQGDYIDPGERTEISGWDNSVNGIHESAGATKDILTLEFVS